MKIKFLIDEDVHIDLAESLRKRGCDAMHIGEVKRNGKSDLEQLEYAVEEQRCIVTFNTKDFVKLHKQYMLSEREHYGILTSPQRGIGEMLKRLLAFEQKFSLESVRNQLEFL
jgi:predicted nuclease of predicted toxin-antitoxin system